MSWDNHGEVNWVFARKKDVAVVDVVAVVMAPLYSVQVAPAVSKTANVHAGVFWHAVGQVVMEVSAGAVAIRVPEKLVSCRMA